MLFLIFLDFHLDLLAPGGVAIPGSITGQTGSLGATAADTVTGTTSNLLGADSGVTANAQGNIISPTAQQGRCFSDISGISLRSSLQAQAVLVELAPSPSVVVRRVQT